MSQINPRVERASPFLVSPQRLTGLVVEPPVSPTDSKTDSNLLIILARIVLLTCLFNCCYGVFRIPWSH